MTEPVSTSQLVVSIPPEDPSFNTIETVTTISTSVLQLLQANIKLPSYNLTPQQQIWINLLITNSPECFVQIDTDIQKMVSSGSIGVQNIPQIIQLCVDILNQATLKQGMANSVNIYVLIKFILDVLLQSPLLPLPANEKTTIQILVDTSLSLLSTSLANTNSPPVVNLNKCCK
jgi:hypothetical protein